MLLSNPLTILLCLSPSSITRNFMHINKSEGEKKATKIQQIIRCPSTEAFNTYIKDGLLQNFNATIDDTNISEAIYGTPTPIIQGKTKRNTPSFVKKHMRIPLPLPTSSNHKRVQVYINLFYINKITFLHTKPGNIQFLYVQ